ncbi:MAG: 16S rRNA (uracil(1498)-N(3))-methyltransferase [Candidatus Schekmanbacteria bacterium]|nr:16S rRNA (uracil(1498)-N(3))-methyltransferase [Candidatus Schekmanbacteria bacterium]
MPSFFINPSAIVDDEITLDPQESHHIQRVLRLDVGDEIMLFDGIGNKYLAVVTSNTSQHVKAKLLQKQTLEPSSVNLTLMQCLPRLDKMDLIVQKAVELGVSRIIPVISQRSQAAPLDRLADKQTRWQRIAQEAAKQCGQPIPPRVEKAQKLPSLIDQTPADALCIACHEVTPHTSLKTLLHRVPNSQTINLLIGSEGGLTPDEADELHRHGWKLAALGPRILRSETAAITALGIIQYELGDWE